MPAAGMNNANSTTSGLYTSGPNTGSSIFDNLFKSKSKAKADATVSDKSSIYTTSTLSSLDKDTRRNVSEPKKLDFLTLATKGWQRPYPKSK